MEYQRKFQSALQSRSMSVEEEKIKVDRYRSLKDYETGEERNFRLYHQDMEERATQLKRTLEYTINKADEDFIENFKQLQEGGLKK